MISEIQGTAIGQPVLACPICTVPLEPGETCPICSALERLRKTVIEKRRERVARGRACLPVGDQE